MWHRAFLGRIRAKLTTRQLARLCQRCALFTGETTWMSRVERMKSCVRYRREFPFLPYEAEERRLHFPLPSLFLFIFFSTRQGGHTSRRRMYCYGNVRCRSERGKKTLRVQHSEMQTISLFCLLYYNLNSRTLRQHGVATSNARYYLRCEFYFVF